MNQQPNMRPQSSETDSPSTDEPEGSRSKWVKTLVFLALIYGVCLVMNLSTTNYSFCVTESWCLSSKEEPFLVAGFQTASFALVLIGAVIGLRWGIAMLVSDRSNIYLGLFFSILGLAGTGIWYMVVPPGERMELIHVPIIGGVMLALGVLFFFFFPGKKTREDRES